MEQVRMSTSANSGHVAGRRRPSPYPRDMVGSPPADGVDAGPPQPKRPRAGRNLPAAIGVGAGLLVIIAASLFLYRPSFAAIVALAVVYASYELSRALDGAIARGATGAATPIVWGRPALVPLAVGGVALVVAAWERGPNGLVVAVLLCACAVFLWRLADGAAGYLPDVTASLLVLLYVPTLAGFAVLSAHADYGAARNIAFIATVVCSDTGGYATGVFFGRHPLAPIVSKAKTWEGFAGSLLCCCGAGVLFLVFTFHQRWWEGLLFGAAICVTATLGDLGESLLKRDLGIKDMGSLLPGHGGIMDRLDSLLPCAAVAYLLLSAFAPA
jgi:phosphatidate cytidylyltransferase